MRNEPSKSLVVRPPFETATSGAICFSGQTRRQLMSKHDDRYRSAEKPGQVRWFASEDNLAAAPLPYQLLGDYAEELRRALADWKVLFFGDQEVAPGQHLASDGRFGELGHHADETMSAAETAFARRFGELKYQADETMRAFETGTAILLGNTPDDDAAVLLSSFTYQGLATWLFDGRPDAAVPGMQRRRSETCAPYGFRTEHYWVDIAKICDWCNAPGGVVCVTGRGVVAQEEHFSRRIYPNRSGDPDASDG